MPKVLSLDKSLNLLEAVCQSADGMGTRALESLLGYNVATIHNIARTFCDRGYLRQDAGTRRFTAGLRLMMLGRHPSYLDSLTELASPIVDEVAEKLNESVLLSTLADGHVMNLKYVPSRQALRVQEPDDVSDHSYCTAFGKVLLATMDDKELENYLSKNELVAHTPATLNTPAKLKTELQKVREQGFAQTLDEYCEGISAIAVPIHDPWGKIVASIGSSAPSIRLQQPGRLEHDLNVIRTAATEIEQRWSSVERSKK